MKGAINVMDDTNSILVSAHQMDGYEIYYSAIYLLCYVVLARRNGNLLRSI